MQETPERTGRWHGRLASLRRPYVWGTLAALAVILIAWWQVQGWYRVRLLDDARRQVESYAMLRGDALEATLRFYVQSIASAHVGTELVLRSAQPSDAMPAGRRGRILLRFARYRGETWVGETSTYLELAGLLSVGKEQERPILALRDIQSSVFYGPEEVFAQAPMVHYVNIPDGYWEMGAIPAEGWEGAIAGRLLNFRLLSLFFGLLLVTWVETSLHYEHRLRHSISGRTRELERALARYWDLFEASPDALFLTDSQGYILAHNQPAVALYGYAPDRLKSMTLSQVLGLSGENELHRALDELLKNEGRSDWLQRRADDESFPAEVGAIISEADNAPLLLVSVRDISERKAAEQALRESEERYRTLFNQVPVGLGRTTPDGRILEANQMLVEMLGYQSAEELMSYHALTNYADPGDRDPWQKELLQHDVLRNYEVRWRRRDGRIIRVRQNTRAIRDADGHPLNYEGMAEDITAVREAEEALVASEARARALLNAPTDVAMLIDLEGTVIAANEAAGRSFGLSVEELIGRRPRDMVPPEVAALRRAKVAEVVRTREPVRFSDKRDGHNFENSLYPILDPDGEVYQVAVYARDITDQRRTLEALRESEARARALFESIGDAFILLDEALRVVEYRDSVDGVLGLEPTEVLGRSFAEALARCSVCENGACRDMLLETLRTGQTQRLSDAIWRGRNDGEEAAYLDMVAYRIVAGGEPRVAVLLRNVSSRRRLQEMLRRRERLETLGEFSTLVAHDFGNILGTISVAGTLLDEDIQSDHPNREDVDAILAEVDVGTRMVQHLIAYCRGEPLAFDLLDLSLLLQQFERTLRLELDRGIDLELRLADGPLAFEGDEVWIQRIFTNLTKNAREAMPNGGTLTIEAHRERLDEQLAATLEVPPGPYMALVVRDTGVGIPQEHLPHLFEPFWTTKKQVGAGLGLAAVYGIVRQHRGAIRVESEPGRGSAFTVYLPAATLEDYRL